MKVENLIKADYVWESRPVTATAVALTSLFIKCAVIPMAQLFGCKNRLLNNGYLAYVHEKSIIRCLALLVPFLGQIYIAYSKETSPIIVRALVQQDPTLLKRASAQLLDDAQFIHQLHDDGYLKPASWQYIGASLTFRGNLATNAPLLFKLSRSHPEAFVDFLVHNRHLRSPEEFASLVRNVWNLHLYANTDDQFLSVLLARYIQNEQHRDLVKCIVQGCAMQRDLNLMNFLPQTLDLSLLCALIEKDHSLLLYTIDHVNELCESSEFIERLLKMNLLFLPNNPNQMARSAAYRYQWEFLETRTLKNNHPNLYREIVSSYPKEIARHMANRWNNLQRSTREEIQEWSLDVLRAAGGKDHPWTDEFIDTLIAECPSLAKKLLKKCCSQNNTDHFMRTFIEKDKRLFDIQFLSSESSRDTFTWLWDNNIVEKESWRLVVLHLHEIMPMPCLLAGIRALVNERPTCYTIERLCDLITQWPNAPQVLAALCLTEANQIWTQQLLRDLVYGHGRILPSMISVLISRSRGIEILCNLATERPDLFYSLSRYFWAHPTLVDVLFEKKLLEGADWSNIPPNVRKDPAFALKAVKMYPKRAQTFADEHSTHKEFFLILLKYDSLSIRQVGEDLFNDPDFIKKCLVIIAENEFLAPPTIWWKCDHQELMLALIKKDPMWIYAASPTLHKNMDFLSSLIEANLLPYDAPLVVDAPTWIALFTKYPYLDLRFQRSQQSPLIDSIRNNKELDGKDEFVEKMFELVGERALDIFFLKEDKGVKSRYFNMNRVVEFIQQYADVIQKAIDQTRRGRYKDKSGKESRTELYGQKTSILLNRLSLNQNESRHVDIPVPSLTALCAKAVTILEELVV